MHTWWGRPTDLCVWVGYEARMDLSSYQTLESNCIRSKCTPTSNTHPHPWPTAAAYRKHTQTHSQWMVRKSSRKQHRGIPAPSGSIIFLQLPVPQFPKSSSPFLRLHPLLLLFITSLYGQMCFYHLHLLGQISPYLWSDPLDNTVGTKAL